MATRAGGKLKPLKARRADEGDPQAPKKDPKEYDEEDAAFLQRKKQEEAALKAAREKGQSGRGAPGGGIKKYVCPVLHD
ncbi:hypothetical protein FOMPIDRAFT_1111426 [Fomitopsis schrenkii]|uniref:Uncharacterized protein n=1 Tax=Fomitopsis schrenkii TaxID=2126942 RepID=S8G593_FOMSC|nr:hypothetical protein FOMPIDRAFT_1111426 [Fomitopsis schrenkii]